MISGFKRVERENALAAQWFRLWDFLRFRIPIGQRSKVPQTMQAAKINKEQREALSPEDSVLSAEKSG